MLCLKCGDAVRSFFKTILLCARINTSVGK